MRCYIVPPHITAGLHRRGDEVPDRAADLAHDNAVRHHRSAVPQYAATSAGVTVYDAQHRQATSSRKVCTDADAGNITRGLDAAEALWHAHGVDVLPTTGFAHYGTRYDNAFWDGSVMCYGDGDGELFGDFTVPVDVCVHERTHGVTGDRLAYSDQAGALNESMSDVAGAVARQQALGLRVDSDSAWLIGAGLCLENGAVALRNMLHPGTAYDTPGLGKDPQPATMAGYVHTTDDDGGVHINSSIPNRAFALACVQHGSADGPFDVWADVLLHATYPTSCTFQQWAQLTVDRSAGSLRAAIVAAWQTVGVEVTSPDPSPAPTPTPAPAPSPTPEGSFRLPADLPDSVAQAVVAAADRAHVSVEAQVAHELVAYHRQRLVEGAPNGA